VKVTRRGSRPDAVGRILDLLDDGFECWLFVGADGRAIAMLTDHDTCHVALYEDARAALGHLEHEQFGTRGRWAGYVAVFQGWRVSA